MCHLITRIPGNNTTDNGKIMFYQGPAQLNLFMVAAVKYQWDYLKNLSSQFGSNQSEYAQKSSENLQVNGYQ